MHIENSCFRIGNLRVMRRYDIPVGNIGNCFTSLLAIANTTPASVQVLGSFHVCFILSVTCRPLVAYVLSTVQISEHILSIIDFDTVVD